MHIGHVALRVRNLDAAARHAERALGLHETSRTETSRFLSSNEKHHELQLVRGDVAALDHVGLEVESAEQVDAIAAAAAAAGARVLAATPEPGLEHSVRIKGPGGIVYEVYDHMRRERLTSASFLRPGVRRLGHLTFFCADHEAVLAFWLDVLGFRVSDRAGGITWTRCDADHHGLAIGPPHPAREGENLLHHHAWEVQDFAALGRYCDDLATKDLRLHWGPVRHGPGANLAVYLPDAEGAVIEVYTDLFRIEDERAYEAVDWTSEAHALNLWGPPPSDTFLSAGVPASSPRSE